MTPLSRTLAVRSLILAGAAYAQSADTVLLNGKIVTADERGSLAVGKLSDLAVLNKDYLSVPVEEIGGICSVLTMVGGRVTYAEGPYGRFDQVGR